MIGDTGEILRKLQGQDPASWPRELRRAFPDRPSLVRECLARLVSTRERGQRDDDETPRLGGAADQRFQIIRRIDEGSTANVYMARDARLKRNVAIKLFRHESSTVQQALEEANLAADVVSEHAIRVLDVGDEGCRPHIVMELVAERRASRAEDPEDDGLELGWSAATTQGRPRSIDEAVRWTIDVAHGVQAAHARDVFHRDIKPQNVLISPVQRKARITDFGLGIGLTVSRGSQLIMTSGEDGPVAISGTPEYMAPEQARGLRIDLDARNHREHRATLIAIDVWGLGALLYQLLSDRAPWSATADEEAWEQARHASPPPLPDRYAGKRIPWRLRRIVERAMALDPKDRYSSPAALAQELENALAQKPTSLDDSIPRRAELWMRRNRQLTLTAISALLCAVLFVASYVGVRQLRVEQMGLTQQIATLENNVRDTRRRLANADGRLQERTAQLAQRDGELRNVSDRLKETQDYLSERQRVFEDEQKRGSIALRAVFHQRDSAWGEIKQLRKDVSERDATAAVLRRDINSVTVERNIANADLTRAKDSLDSVTKERDTALADLAAAKKSLGERTTERNTAREDLAAAKKSLGEVTTERNTAREDLAAAKKSLGEVTKERNTVREDLAAAKKSLGEVTKERDTARDELSKLKSASDKPKTDPAPAKPPTPPTSDPAKPADPEPGAAKPAPAETDAAQPSATPPATKPASAPDATRPAPTEPSAAKP